MGHGGAMVDHEARGKGWKTNAAMYACCVLEQASNKLPENWFGTQKTLAPSRHS